MSARPSETAPLFFVLGPRRSGTNLTEALLVRNFRARVADLNANPIRPPRPERPHLKEAYGGKHDIDVDAVLRMLDAGGRVVAQSRNPVDWLIARCRYQALIDARTAERVIAERMRTWLETEYAGFWKVIRAAEAARPGAALLRQRYEDVALDQGAAMLALAGRLDIAPKNARIVPIEDELRPGGGTGAAFDASASPFARYDRAAHPAQVAAVREVLSEELLAFLGYGAARDEPGRTPKGRDAMDDFDIDARHIEMGSEYGAWPVCTEVVRGPLTVYGVGVGTDISWDRAVIAGFDATVHAFDPTPVSRAWIDRQTDLPARFNFHPVGLAAQSGTLRLDPPAREGFASYHVNKNDDAGADGAVEVPVEPLGTLMERAGHDRVDILKMDIEGSEYAVIQALAKGRVRPTQILIEFHHDMHGFTWRDTNAAHRHLHAMGYRRFFRSKRGGREQGFVHLETLLRARGRTRGVVYFAFGREALREANASAASLRESNPGLPSAVFTDLPDEARHDIVYDFDAQERRDIEYHFRETRRMASLKVRFLMRSPFERTVVLDADTYVKGDISEMFDALDTHDIALTNMPEIEQGVEPGKERPVHKSLKSLTRQGSFSCAVFAYRKSAPMRALAFEWWSQYVEKTAGAMRDTGNWGAVGGGMNEQAILHHMMRDGTFGRCGVSRTLLPNVRFNAGMTMWPRLRKEGLWEDCRVLHSHLIYQKKDEVGIEGLPDLPNLQKFL